jgi:predicted PhzF superfamily epimerase YddE/YHI9
MFPAGISCAVLRQFPQQFSDPEKAVADRGLRLFTGQEECGICRHGKIGQTVISGTAVLPEKDRPSRTMETAVSSQEDSTAKIFMLPTPF